MEEGARRTEGRKEGRMRAGWQPTKLEPHTEMWGKRKRGLLVTEVDTNTKPVPAHVEQVAVVFLELRKMSNMKVDPMKISGSSVKPGGVGSS